MSLKDYRISLLPHVTRIVADATATKAQPLGAVPTAGRRRSLFLAPRQNQHFLMVLFAGYADIADSLAHLKQIDRYLNRAPTRTSPISRSAYLSYHYNAFLNELAITEERIAHHLTLLSHKYRLEPDAPRIQCVQQPRGEMQCSGGRGDRPFFSRKHRLVIGAIGLIRLPPRRNYSAVVSWWPNRT